MKGLQICLPLCLAIACILIQNVVESKKKFQNEISGEDQDERKFFISVPLALTAIAGGVTKMAIGSMAIGATSVAIGITNRAYANKAANSAAERYEQVRERDEGLWKALNDRLTQIYRGIKSHTTSAILNTQLNKEVFVSDGLYRLGKKIVDLKKDEGNDDEIKILATKILEGRDENGEKLKSLDGGAKRTLKRMNRLFTGNRHLHGTQDPIILTFANALEEKSPTLMRDALKFIGNFFEVQKKCVDALLLASEVLPQNVKDGADTEELEKRAADQKKILVDLFNTPALAAFRWLPATSSAIPTDRNIVVGDKNRPVCSVEKDGKSYIGVLERHNKCMYTTDGKSQQTSGDMFLLYNSCAEYDVDMTKSPSNSTIFSKDQKSMICRDWEVLDNDHYNDYWHEGYGNGRDGKCKCAHEIYDEGFFKDDWIMSARTQDAKEVMVSQCNVKELYNKQFGKVGVFLK